MSRENVELAATAWKAVGERGPEAMLEYLHPKVEWRVRPDLPDAGTYRGHDGFRALLAEFDQAFEEQHYEPLELIALGSEAVAVPLRWWGRGRASGATVVERHETWVFTIRDRLITRVEEFATKDEALEALGLRE
jgi:ketosteroid isomerase-like protein